MLYELDGVRPQLDNGAWAAPTAVLIGRVILRADASVWWGAVLRGDNEPIEIGEGSNVQDGCVLHTDPGAPLVLAPNVTVGHLAMLHGCTVGEDSLIGIGAMVLNGARIGRGCVIGAGALVTEDKEIPDRSLVLGSPGKVVKPVDPDLLERSRRGTAKYVANARRYARGLRTVG
jgi:carbonic anhydrase/acetyltransferase-like protein (isoleucine patch superfamily)